MIKWINKRRKRKGFSLVELVVVVAILGIISAVAIPKLSETQERAKFSADKATLAVLNSAVAVAVAEGRIINDDDLTVSVDANGDITAVINGEEEDDDEPLLEDGAAFQLEINKKVGTLTWKVANGVITGSPSITEEEDDSETGPEYGEIVNPSAGGGE